MARAGLRELLSERPALQVVGEAANGVEAISQAMALRPAVIVMDASMPQMNGIEALVCLIPTPTGLAAWLLSFYASIRLNKTPYFGTLHVAVAVIEFPAISTAVAVMVYVRPFPLGARSARN